MSVNIGSQQLSLTDRATTHMEPSSSQNTIPVNLVEQQLSSINNQSEQADLLPRFQSIVPVNFGSQQLSSSENHQTQTKGQSSRPVNLGAYPLQSVPMESQLNVQTPMSAYFGLRQLSPTIRRPSVVQPSLNVRTSMSINTGSQLLLSTSKRPPLMEASPKFRSTMPINLGSQQMSANKRPHMEPPSKLQSESFESVRSKLRESLANAFGMGSQQQSMIQIVDSISSDSANAKKKEDVGAPPDKLHPVTTNASSCETSAETLASNEHYQKCNEGQGLSSDTGSNENTSDKTKAWKCDVLEYQTQNILPDDESPFSSNSTIKDELLLGHGLCWASDIDNECSEAMDNHITKRSKLEQEEITKDSKDITLIAETLATQIEAELFRFFGGVNKKYKEKGRSLLFNLKDRNNPELRERVLSGEIVPERLCSMTAEELASKELSEWRLAKAEEFAQMVVLQDSEVDIRRLVRKTHKGEFQVEFEQDDSVSVEAGLDASVLSHVPRKSNEEAQAQSTSNDKDRTSSNPSETKASEGLQSEKGSLGDQNLSSNLDVLPHEKNDLIQEFLVDELKETELLPSIVSLDEFMEALDKEPPFENLPMDTEVDIPSSAEKNSNNLDCEMSPASEVFESKMIPVPDSLGSMSDPAPDILESKTDDSQDIITSKPDPSDTIPENPVDISPYKNSKMDETNAATDSTLKSGSVHDQPVTVLADVPSKSEYIWEGIIQLNISALATVIGFFRSGEKTSTREWSGFLDIKGRVRLDAFEKFLQELPLSRSRAIMITQFSWKEGSPEVGRLYLSETVNSYVADERVGFAEPTPGVELYFCPPHPKTIEILVRNLPKEHTAGVHSAFDGLIGVVVWRRPVTVSPRMSSHQKHKKQFSSRKQQDANPNITPAPSMPGLPPTIPQPSPDDEPIDDVPPGFGPRDEDDLPEFDFVNSNSRIPIPLPSQGPGMGLPSPRVLLPPPPPPCPAEQMRNLIHKYGQSGSARKPALEMQPWNDDDDIPEWQPHQDNHPQTQPPVLPAPPPPPPLQYPQQPLQHFMANQQNFVPLPPPPQLFPHAPPQQLVSFAMPLPPMPLQPPMGLMMPGPPNMHPGWQPAPWLPHAQGPADAGMPFNGAMQPYHFAGQPGDGGQFYGMPTPAQNGMVWRPDIPRSHR